jgi:hypothetical protein
MLYVDLFRDRERQGGFHRINCSYGEARTLQLAKNTLASGDFPWAKAYEVVNEEHDILAVGWLPDA